MAAVIACLLLLLWCVKFHGHKLLEFPKAQKVFGLAAEIIGQRHHPHKEAQTDINNRTYNLFVQGLEPFGGHFGVRGILGIPGSNYEPNPCHMAKLSDLFPCVTMLHNAIQFIMEKISL